MKRVGEPNNEEAPPLKKQAVSNSAPSTLTSSERGESNGPSPMDTSSSTATTTTATSSSTASSSSSSSNNNTNTSTGASGASFAAQKDIDATDPSSSMLRVQVRSLRGKVAELKKALSSEAARASAAESTAAAHAAIVAGVNRVWDSLTSDLAALAAVVPAPEGSVTLTDFVAQGDSSASKTSNSSSSSSSSSNNPAASSESLTSFKVPLSSLLPKAPSPWGVLPSSSSSTSQNDSSSSFSDSKISESSTTRGSHPTTAMASFASALTGTPLTLPEWNSESAAGVIPQKASDSASPIPPDTPALPSNKPSINSLIPDLEKDLGARAGWSAALVKNVMGALVSAADQRAAILTKLEEGGDTNVAVEGLKAELAALSQSLTDASDANQRAAAAEKLSKAAADKAEAAQAEAAKLRGELRDIQSDLQDSERSAKRRSEELSSARLEIENLKASLARGGGAGTGTAGTGAGAAGGSGSSAGGASSAEGTGGAASPHKGPSGSGDGANGKFINPKMKARAAMAEANAARAAAAGEDVIENLRTELSEAKAASEKREAEAEKATKRLTDTLMELASAQAEAAEARALANSLTTSGVSMSPENAMEEVERARASAEATAASAAAAATAATAAATAAAADATKQQAALSSQLKAGEKVILGLQGEVASLRAGMAARDAASGDRQALGEAQRLLELVNSGRDAEKAAAAAAAAAAKTALDIAEKEGTRLAEELAEEKNRVETYNARAAEWETKEAKLMALIGSLREKAGGGGGEGVLAAEVEAEAERAATAERSVAALRAEVKSYRASVARYEERQTELVSQVHSLKEELGALTGELGALGETYEGLRKQNADLVAGSQKSTGGSGAADVFKATQLADALRHERDSLAMSVKAADAERKAVAAMAASANQAVAAAEAAAEAARQEGTVLVVEVERLRRTVDALRTESANSRALAASKASAHEQSTKSVEELSQALEREKRSRGKADEERAALRARVQRMAALGGAAGVENLEEQLAEAKKHLTCSVCHDREKNVILTTCYHTFCRDCVQRNLEIRSRKCPRCLQSFGKDDVHEFWL